MGVRRPYAWESQTTHLQKDERLTTLRPDWHVRRGRDGLHKAYLCTDKRGTHLICTQKLPLLAEHINDHEDHLATQHYQLPVVVRLLVALFAAQFTVKTTTT